MTHKFKIGDVVEVVTTGCGFSSASAGKKYTILNLGVYRSQMGYIVTNENGEIYDNDMYLDYVGESSFKLVEEKSVEQYYKNFNRGLIEDMDTGEKEIHIFVEDCWIDRNNGYLKTEGGLDSFKLLKVFAPPPEFENYLHFGYCGKLLCKAESQEDRAKREQKAALLADVAKAQQTLRDLQTKLDSM